MGFCDEDGYLFFTDRAKDMIVRGGFNVYSVEVENVLYEHPGVKQCAVVGKPHDKLGEDVVAFVDSVEKFPTSGTVQIEDEIFTYSDIDRENRTLGSDSSPLVRSNACCHGINAPVIASPESGCAYLVSDHPCKEIDNVYADGRILSNDEYSVNTELLEGKEVYRHNNF